MHDQGGLADRSDLIVRCAERVDPPLPGGREHGRERFLETGTDAGLVADLGQLIGDQIPGVGEIVQHPAHTVQRRLISPCRVERLGDVERNTDTAHQHQTIEAVWVINGEPQGDGAAETVAHQRDPLQSESIEESQQLVDPGLQSVANTHGPLGETETGHIGCVAVEPVG